MRTKAMRYAHQKRLQWRMQDFRLPFFTGATSLRCSRVAPLSDMVKDGPLSDDFVSKGVYSPRECSSRVKRPAMKPRERESVKESKGMTKERERGGEKNRWDGQFTT